MAEAVRSANRLSKSGTENAAAAKITRPPELRFPRPEPANDQKGAAENQHHDRQQEGEISNP